MTWVAWRQYRLEMLVGLALLVGLGVFLLPTGLQKLALFNDSGLAASLRNGGADVADLATSFLKSYGSLNAIVGYFTLAPVIVGMMAATPIVLDFEQRTYRLAWTQSVTRGRWLAARLGLALLGVLLFSLTLTILMTWWLGPQDKLQTPFGQGFNLEGFVPSAYAVFTFAVALAVGALSRRTVLAVVAGLLIFVPLWGVVQDVLRPHYLAPLERVTSLGDTQQPSVPERAWLLDIYYVDENGNRWTKQQLSDELTRSGTKDPAVLESRGIRTVTVFHPADRFWTFQAIEAAIFLGAAALLLGLTVWVVTRRMR